MLPAFTIRIQEQFLPRNIPHQSLQVKFYLMLCPDPWLLLMQPEWLKRPYCHNPAGTKRIFFWYSDFLSKVFKHKLVRLVKDKKIDIIN